MTPSHDSKNLSDMTPGEILARLDDLEESYDIAYRAAQEADWPNGPIDDPRPAFLDDLRAADRQAGYGAGYDFAVKMLKRDVSAVRAEAFREAAEMVLAISRSEGLIVDGSARGLLIETANTIRAKAAEAEEGGGAC